MLILSLLYSPRAQTSRYFAPVRFVAAFLVAPVVGGVLPGDAHPGADLADEAHLDAGLAFMGVAGMVAVQGQ